MAARPMRTLAFVLPLVGGCAGAPAPAHEPACDLAGRFPVRPCAGAAHPERAGVWQNDETGWALVYDGCQVAFEHTGARELPFDGELRSLAGGAIVVDWREWGDPPPYYRAAAAWRDDLLLSRSIIGERAIARWDGEAMRSLHHWRENRFRRVTSEAALSRQAHQLLCVERVTPTEAELARERGVPLPDEPEPSPPTPMQRMLREAEAQRQEELVRRVRAMREAARHADAGTPPVDGGAP